MKNVLLRSITVSGKKMSLLLAFLLYPFAQNAWAFWYYDHVWDDTEKKVIRWEGSLATYEYDALIKSEHPEAWVKLTADKKWAATDDAQREVLEVMDKDVHLYLCNDAVLEVKHIKLEKGASLHIHCESSGYGIHIGKLVVNNDVYEGAAGIGGGNGADAGDLYIHGGNIIVTGYEGAAAIGGGKNGSGGNVIVYDGTLTAYGGEKAAGIGGGEGKGLAEGCSIDIHGGTVTARGGAQGAAIGGGANADGGNVTITDGTVNAFPGESGFGIGRGYDCSSNNAKTTITSGTVYAGTEDNIRGYSMSGTLILSDQLKVFRGDKSTALGSTPVACAERVNTCVYYDGMQCVKIEPCTNHHYVDYICAYCGNEYYASVSGTWMDDDVRAAAFSVEDTGAKTISITSEAELGLLAYNISHDVEGHGYSGYTITLAKNLDMSAHHWAGYGTFKGTLDGQGHTISGLIYSKNNTGTAGLIANNYGTVQNVKVASSLIVGNRYVGAIVGHNDGIVENCYVADDVSVYASDDDDLSKACGGVVGWQYLSPLSNVTTTATRGCYSEASVVGYDNVGGIIGRLSSGELEHCVAKATVNCKTDAGKKDIIAGLVEDGATISDNFYLAEATIENANGKRLYGVRLSNAMQADNHQLNYAGTAGKAYDVSRLNIYGSQIAVANDWYIAEEGSFSFTLEAGSPDVAFKYVAVNGNELTATDDHYTFAATTEATEYIIDATTWEGEGTEASPYLIQTLADWNALCRVFNGSSAGELFSGKYFRQTADLDIMQGIGVTGQSSSKAFCGTYDGDKHVLNCSLMNPQESSTEAVAPFHRVKNANIKNLHVTGSISGGMHTAGLVAYTEGKVEIRDCRVSATITCTGVGVNDAHGGGFVGHANESDLYIVFGLFDGALIAVPNGKGDIRLGAFSGWAGSRVRVKFSAEAGKYSGMTDKSQTAFSWRGEGSTNFDFETDENDRWTNIYISDLGHDSQAFKGYKVVSGTEGLVLDFSPNGWNHDYLGGAVRTADGSYIIADTFYLSEYSSDYIKFKVSYPSDKVLKGLSVNGVEPKAESDYYVFESDLCDFTITASFAKYRWTDEGKYATEFANVDDKKKIVTITKPEELARLAKLVYDGTDSGKDWTYLLDDNLDMSLYDWTPIGNGLEHRFCGKFDGQGHTISGINIPDPDKNYVGLFGVVNGGVYNLKLVNSKIEGKGYVGGIAGMVRYDIVNCYVGDDVTVTGSYESCGGVVGAVSSQNNESGGYAQTDAWVRGCYSAATVSGESRVGGIAGNLAAGTVHWNVSNAKVSSTNGTVAYEVGNKASGATMEWNFYIGKEDKINDNDTHTYKITLHPNLLLMGFAFNISKDNYFDVSGVTIDANATVKVGDDLYGTANKHIDFSIPDISGGCKVENVKVNDDEPTDIGSGVYRFTLTADSQVAGDAAFNLYDDSNWNDPDELHNNIAILGYNRYRLANVTLQGRKLYKDGCWNTLCLPFDLLDEDSSDDLTFTGTPLEGATVKTLESSWFDKNTGTLNLTFSEGSKKSIEPGIPYIVKWPSDGTVIENPKFNHVVVEYDPEEDPKAIGNEETDAAIFYGNYVQVVFPENTDPDTFNRILYMGANNKLYYPKANGNVTINCFRGIFQLREDLAATDLQDNSVKSIVLDFGDGETDGISILTPTSSSKREGSGYFMLDGRHINGKPSQKGLYINNGRKIIIK